jgi:hypothetical protein
VTDLRESHASPTADICRAVDILRDDRTPAAIATAELLEAIADDMHDAGAYQRQAFAGTPAEHPVVWDRERARHDWTAALELAHTVLRRTR